MTIQKPCGILYKPHGGHPTYLPLHEVRVQAVIVDVSAKVILSQVFVNDSNAPAPRAKYVFPVPARAAVCAFEMEMEDGRVITGVVKEKQKAAEEHQKAMKQGKVTSLMEWATDDVFVISVGSIPAQQKIITKLTYAIDLMNDDLTDQIRFQLPMSVGMRYGELPDTMSDASRPSPSTRVRIVLGIQTKGNIQSVISPSHPNILAQPFKFDNGEPSSNRYIATYETPDFLTQDFVVNIQAEGLDEPRCFAEKDEKHGSIAMQLTLVPKFNLPPIASQEYIFLIDRSGSMKGNRIETAKRTLVMLLRSLPAFGTTFNIFSFGGRSSKLFDSSLEYTQDTLTSATNHVDSMSADYGGTKIRSALHHVFTSRNMASPTAVFVLTDGEVYDFGNTFATVSDAIANATTEAPLRVFTLGIGQTTSSAMCEGIARVGNGICLMATSSENILGKCAKLVRASRTFVLKNVSIDWGAPPTNPQETSVVLQAPRKIESIYPGCRLVIFALIKDLAFKIPEHVILGGRRDGEGETMEFKVPVELVEPTQEGDTIPLVNTLAARRIITELEDPGPESTHSEDYNKATIVQFGEEYQLASRYTSFVAIGDHVSEYQKEAKGKEKKKQQEPEVEPVGADNDKDDDEEWDDLTSAPPAVPTPESPNKPPHISSASMPWPRTQPLSQTPSSRAGVRDPQSSHPTDAKTPSDPKTWVRVQAKSMNDVRWPGPNSISDPPPPTQMKKGEAPVVRLVRLQAFDGSFTLNEEFIQIVGKEAAEKGKTLGVDDIVWATAVAVAFLRKFLANQPDLLEGLVEKAMDFIANSPLAHGVDFKALVEQAKNFV